MRRRLRNRKGAMLVLGAVLFMGLMVMAMLAIDFSRVVAQRNQLHTATDAGALAGAIQIPRNRAAAADSAITYTQVNNLPGATSPVVELGRWNDAARTFNVTDPIEANAIRVTTQRSTNYLLGSLVNVLPATMRRTSVAWATAPVTAAPCVRPWALPYDSLLARLGITNPNHVLTDADLQALRGLPIASRRVTLKLPSPSFQHGNYNAVVVPSYWRASTGTYRSPRPQGGASRYRLSIFTESCEELVGVGDSLDLEPGNMTQPTIDGVDELCDLHGGGTSGDNCLNVGGAIGLPIKIAFYGSDVIIGRDQVKVRAIGGFVLESIRHNNPDKSEITGYFEVVPSGGIVGSGGNTTLTRPILVQ